MAPKTKQEKQEEFLPYEMSYIPEEYRRRAKAELFEDEDTRVHSLKLFRSMLNDEPDLNYMDDELFLLSFLRARKFDVKRAFQLVKTFYTVKRKRTELYDNFDFADVTRTLQEKSVGFLPYRDREGCVILVIKCSNWKPLINTSGDVLRALTCSLLHANLSPVTQIAGFKVILDVEGITLSHLPHISPSHIWLLAEAICNCFPGRFRAIHAVNENFVFYYFWAAVKQLISKKIADRFHFHGKNVKKLHKYFSPSLLPAEFGGDLGPFDNSEFAKMMQDRVDYFYTVTSYGYQKSKTKAQEKSSSAEGSSTKEKRSRSGRSSSPERGASERTSSPEKSFLKFLRSKRIS